MENNFLDTVFEDEKKENGFVLAKTKKYGPWVFYYNRTFTQKQFNRIITYFFYHKNNAGTYFIGSKNEFEDFCCCYPNSADTAKYISFEMIDNWYPVTFAEKVDKILLYLAEQTSYLGINTTLTSGLKELFFVETKEHLKEQFGFFFHFLQDEGYIRDFAYIDGTQPKKLDQLQEFDWYWEKSAHPCDIRFILTPKAWERIYELQKNQVNNKKVFVSMSFNNTQEIREAIRQGIKDAKMDDEFIDEIIHNHQIVPEMFRLIRESKYLVLEISDPNFGAYYEAGYALGQGKEVIVCCSKEVFDKKYETQEEKKYERYLKPHFDIFQKQMIKWENKSDLTKKLTEWLKALESEKGDSNI